MLEHLSFQIPQGAYVGIIGPNGGGKTTVLKLILGLLQPNAGNISIFGHDVRTAKKHFEMGYVPQKMSGLEKNFPATVQEIIASGRTARRGVFSWKTAHDFEIITRSMEQTNVAHLKHRLIGTLSGGERQRVFIARALAREPKILILDEPTIGVDLQAQDAFYTLLNALNKKFDITILLVSHDIDVISEQVETILCLNKALMCQLPSRSFNKQEYVEQFYGKTAKPVEHEHKPNAPKHTSP